MNPSGGIWPGKRITPSRKILRGEDALTVRQAINGLLNSKILRNQAGSNKFSITPENAVFEVSDRALSEDAPPFHPFQIYVFPEDRRSHANSDDNFRVKVRGGWMQYIGAGSAKVFGTDYIFDTNQASFFEDGSGLVGQVAPTDGSQIVPGGGGYDHGGWNEIVVPDDATYYFWVNLFTSMVSGTRMEPCVCFGASPTGATIMATGETFNDDYDGFPAADAYHVPIGSMERTASGLLITQLISDNILTTNLSGSYTRGQIAMRFRGEWDEYFPSEHEKYYVGDVVTQTVTASSRTTITTYVYDPGSSSSYRPEILFTPLHNIDPSTHTPDPWRILSKSFADVDYHVDGSYQAAKAYLRTA